MRLNKIKLAGFKSFVDPTTVNFPGNLTGVVGPNGCGKSNIIDAVRWVMGEISAKHLRGDSMADVVFNGSSSRKPVGTASVELVFDNSDGKLGGQYANFNEVSLKRVVSRDGTSAYFLNGARCRRKDITQLFLGTGLGSRSYAIIEQGMISRVIEARGAARLHRGGRRHLQIQGAPPRDREPHRPHQGEPRAPQRRPRGGRQAAAPPAAPGGDCAALPDPQAGGAQDHRGADRPAPEGPGARLGVQGRHPA
jgi:energy-coupling factor transporter ATP-binding protein EcfA2